MRKVLFNAWVSEIDAAMADRLPRFQRLSKKAPGEWPNIRKFIWQHPSGLFWAIAFRPLDEQFDAYVGWGRNSQLPFKNIVQAGGADLLTHHDLDGLMLPTATIAGRHGATYWSFWEPGPDVADNPELFAMAFAEQYERDLSKTEAAYIVRGPIDEAMREIEEYCIPYLTGVTEKNG